MREESSITWLVICFVIYRIAHTHEIENGVFIVIQERSTLPQNKWRKKLFGLRVGWRYRQPT